MSLTPKVMLASGVFFCASPRVDIILGEIVSSLGSNLLTIPRAERACKIW